MCGTTKERADSLAISNSSKNVEPVLLCREWLTEPMSMEIVTLANLTSYRSRIDWTYDVDVRKLQFWLNCDNALNLYLHRYEEAHWNLPHDAQKHVRFVIVP